MSINFSILIHLILKQLKGEKRSSDSNSWQYFLQLKNTTVRVFHATHADQLCSIRIRFIDVSNNQKQRRGWRSWRVASSTSLEQAWRGICSESISPAVSLNLAQVNCERDRVATEERTDVMRGSGDDQFSPNGSHGEHAWTPEYGFQRINRKRDHSFKRRYIEARGAVAPARGPETNGC